MYICYKILGARFLHAPVSCDFMPLWATRHTLALQLFGQIEVAHLDPSISAILARQFLTPNLGAPRKTRTNIMKTML